MAGNESHVLLGKPTFEPIGNGKVRCVETGHEMPQDQALSYGTSKKCLEALFDVALAQGKPPLNFFHQSPDARNMVVCKLTGALVKKDEDSIWKHVTGKKFQRELEKEERKKTMPNMSTNALGCATDNGAAQEPDEKDCLLDIAESDGKANDKKKLKKKGSVKIDQEASCVDGSQNEDEEPVFWMPPIGDRWDFDSGGGRWAAGDNLHTASSKDPRERHLVQAANKHNEGVESRAEGDLQDKSQSDSESDVMRLKRLSLSKSSSKSASLRKKRKTNF